MKFLKSLTILSCIISATLSIPWKENIERIEKRLEEKELELEASNAENAMTKRKLKLNKNNKLDELLPDFDLIDEVLPEQLPGVMPGGRIDISQLPQLPSDVLSSISQPLDDMKGVVMMPKKQGKHEKNKGKGKIKKNPLEMLPLGKSPMNFLEHFGYLKKTTHGKHALKAMVKGIRKFQKMYHMTPSGVLDVDTVTAMLKSRCGMADAVPPLEDFMDEGESLVTAREKRDNHVNMAKRFQAKGYRWPIETKGILTYAIGNYSATSSMSQSLQRRAIVDGLTIWAKYSGLLFREASWGEKADINVMFTKGWHGDGEANKFDGPSGVLAHAFLPTSGEAHFDDAETWTDGTYSGINMMIVAAHEFGHAMGLSHSEVKGALMAPYYQGYEEDFDLRTDDISGIQALYGQPSNPTVYRTTPEVRTTPTTTTTRTTPPPPVSPAPNGCDIIFKAVTQTYDYRVNVFHGEWMWRISEYGLDEGFPMLIRDLYENPPRDISAAYFSWDTYYTYFFKGNTIWRYYGFYLMDTKTISAYTYPRFVRAAVETPDGLICLVQGEYCYIFDEDTMDVTGVTTHFNKVFPYTPTSFDSLLKLTGEDYLYFFFGTYYDKYSLYYKSLLAGYPRSKAGPWMGPACGGPSNSPR